MRRILVTAAAVGAAVTTLATSPGTIRAQEARALRPRLELCGGWAKHGGGGCYEARASGVAVGGAIQTRSRFAAGLGLDLFLASTSCLDVLLVRDYRGRQVEVWGDPSIGPRLSVAVGYGFSVLGVRPELSAGLGTVLTKTDYGRGREDTNFRPWYGGSANLRLRSGVGVRFEVGRHQLAERYYEPSSDVVVAKINRWELMWQVGITVPIRGAG